MRLFPVCAPLITGCLVAVTGLAIAGNHKTGSPDLSAKTMPERQRALHALNRLSFGPRPGEVQRVMAMGVDKWIDLQLHPEKINDSALDARLLPFRTLRMNTVELAQNFPSEQMVKAAAEGRMPLPSDAAERAVYESQIEKYRERQARKAEQQSSQASENQALGNASAGQNILPASVGSGGASRASTESTQSMQSTLVAPPENAAAEQEQAAKREERRQAQQRAGELELLPPDQRFREFLNMDPPQRQGLASLPLPEREQLLAGLTPQQRETVTALVQNPQTVVTTELQQAKLLRAIYSERQLDEVMTDFWFNHFNVFVGKGADRYLLTPYERDVIRAHALGKFKDLLVATAKSPAMLFYLDNWQSIGPDSDFAVYGNQAGTRWRNWGPRRQPARKSSGLNENYARELMELHTLGVNGGYTQKDVTEVAKVFTGWTLEKPQRGAEFEYDERKHEPGNKVVLGRVIKNQSEKEGMLVLDMLAHHPSTAHFVCTKLAQRFVADDPPPALVDRMARRFLDTDGDIREVLGALFTSPEFWSPHEFRAKVKTPLEFVVSAARSTGADVENAMPLVQALNRMGMPLYGAQPPTGYSMKAETWVNSAALLNRMNFALNLAGGRLPGMSVDLQPMLGGNTPAASEKGVTPAAAIAQTIAPSPATPARVYMLAAARTEKSEVILAELETSLLAGDVSSQTHQTISRQLEDPMVTQRVLDDPTRPPNVAAIAGLILGSPEFQRR